MRWIHILEKQINFVNPSRGVLVRREIRSPAWILSLNRTRVGFLQNTSLFRATIYRLSLLLMEEYQHYQISLKKYSIVDLFSPAQINNRYGFFKTWGVTELSTPHAPCITTLHKNKSTIAPCMPWTTSIAFESKNFKASNSSLGFTVPSYKATKPAFKKN